MGVGGCVCAITERDGAVSGLTAPPAEGIEALAASPS